MSILAVTLPAAGTVAIALPPLSYPHQVASPGAGFLAASVNPQPTGPQFFSDHAGTPLNTVVQQPDFQEPKTNGAGVTIPPSTPTPPPNTTTWLLQPDMAVLTEPF